jgi:hypothetical protein
MTDTSVTITTREARLPAGGSVDITLASSDVRVRGTDGDRVVVRARDGEPLPDDLRVDADAGIVRVHEGALRVGPLVFSHRRSRHFDIDLPRMASVSVRTMSGDVEASGIAGPSRWASASGDLRITTSTGPVQVETMSGDAVLEASGSISLAARTVSGDLRIRAPRIESLDASTTSGDVQVEADLDEGPRHSISSVSGDVSIATGSPVRLEAQTIAGDVRASGPHAAEGGRGRRTLVVGKGSVALSVRTTSGDVRLRVLGRGSIPADAVAAVAPEPVPFAVPVPPAPAGPPIPDPIDSAVRPVPPVPPELPVVPVMPLGPDAAAADEPEPDEETQAWNASESAAVRREAARLDVLRALERGDLDVEAATRRLEALEEAGPVAFRGWC